MLIEMNSSNVVNAPSDIIIIMLVTNMHFKIVELEHCL